MSDTPLPNPDPGPVLVLNLRQLHDVAYARANALSWEATARRLRLDPDELRLAVACDDRYDDAYEHVERDLQRETLAELRFAMRASIRESDGTDTADAQERLSRHLCSFNRDQTRLKVETMRADVHHARLALQAAKHAAQSPPTPPTPPTQEQPEAQQPQAQEQQQPQEEEDPAPDRPYWDVAARFKWTPQQYAEFMGQLKLVAARNEQLYAIDVSKHGQVVYLWGGKHRIGAHPPDATDTAVYLHADHTCAAKWHRVYYWAIPNPPPTDPHDGPFPDPEEPQASVKAQVSSVGSQQTDPPTDAPPG